MAMIYELADRAGVKFINLPYMLITLCKYPDIEKKSNVMKNLLSGNRNLTLKKNLFALKSLV